MPLHQSPAESVERLAPARSEDPGPLARIGRIAVTGGASGLGAATAQAIADAGGRPAVIDVSAPEEGTPWLSRTADVADRGQVERAIEEIADELGGLDAIVTAAGIDRCGRLEDVAADEWERVVAVNLLGTASAVRAALPHLRRSHGRVVTVASSLALRALPEATAYCASKSAVLGFSRALAAELRGEVGVTTLVPAGMRTRFFDDRPERYRPAADAHLIDPADVARTIVFALGQPVGCEVRELVVCPDDEPSWP